MSISSTIVLSVLCHRVSVCYDMQNQLKLIDFIAYWFRNTWESADHLFHKKRARQSSRILGTKYGKYISREGGG